MFAVKYSTAVRAGESLVQAQEYERNCAELYCRHPEQDDLRDAWVAARKLVEQLSKNYFRSCNALTAEDAEAAIDAEALYPA